MSVEWSGTLRGVQPRIRLLRSLDQRAHTYLGYHLLVTGEVDGVPRDFVVAIGKAAQAKYGFRAGDTVEGAAVEVADPRREAADYYRASRLRAVSRRAEDGASAGGGGRAGSAGDAGSVGSPGSTGSADDGPPWLGLPPDLEVYRERGHRRLAARTYDTRCGGCRWGCRMAVEMIIDQWNPTYRYRFETFCYGPKSCPLYAAGPTRKVPGRRGMSYEEEDWVDEDATEHRGWDE